ncbi:MAG TPA: hypothetical protein VEQ65_11720, partial [Opitutus sp.]|nr:hypothetical protein [Opitutus sp.]
MPGVADGALVTYTESTNGLTEYVANNFNGEMRGNLIAATYDGKLLRIALNSAGTAVTNGVEFLASGFGNLPLDVTAPDPGHGGAFLGTVWVAHYAPAKISILEPADFDSPGGATCTGINSYDVDEDGDGFSNADEIANNSDPCSGAIRPPDVDGDQVSDLKDTDDDNDGIPDAQDPFQIDPVDGYSVPVPLRYDLFNETGIGFYGVGFTGVMMNRGSDYLALRSNDNIIAGGTAGLFTVANAGAGHARGSTNTQKDAYHFAFNSNEFTAPYVVTSRLGGPFFNSTPTANQRQGIYLGNGDQNNYISLALHANSGSGGIEVVYEVDGSIVSENVYALPNPNASSTIDLSFLVDPIAGTVQPRYQRPSDANPVNVGSPIHVTGEVLSAVMGPAPLAIGLFATTGNSSTPAFSATWDYFEITAVPNTAIAKITIDPTGTNIATSSTYNTGSFKIQNLSTGGQHIDHIEVDISTSILPDLVFDTSGAAGDPVAKNFTADTASSGVVLASGGTIRPHNGTNANDGFDAVAMDFTTFPVNGTFSFSIDIDPNNVKGVAQPGERDSASVSGLDLLGTTATVYFSDGTVHRTRVGRIENSVDGSYGWLRAAKPPQPGVQFLGHTKAPFQTGQASQTVRVSGPAGLTASLVVVEAGLYLGGVPGGGYNVQPYDANTVIKVTEYSGVIGQVGYVDIPVTL